MNMMTVTILINDSATYTDSSIPTASLSCSAICCSFLCQLSPIALLPVSSIQCFSWNHSTCSSVWVPSQIWLMKFFYCWQVFLFIFLWQNVSYRLDKLWG